MGAAGPGPSHDQALLGGLALIMDGHAELQTPRLSSV